MPELDAPVTWVLCLSFLVADLTLRLFLSLSLRLCFVLRSVSPRFFFPFQRQLLKLRVQATKNVDAKLKPVSEQLAKLGY